MKPVPISHNEYRASLRNGRRQYYPDASKISKDTWTIYNQFKKLDLSRVDTLMQDKYSLFGPPPWPPSAMLRSLLLAVKVKVFSITAWVRDLQINPLYAIISGFQPYNVPGVYMSIENPASCSSKFRPSIMNRYTNYTNIICQINEINNFLLTSNSLP